MLKIILLDWDGPLSNSRTWSMPHYVDPVAVQFLNEAYECGWHTVLTSTKRKNIHDVDQASEWLARVGIRVRWYDEQGDNWRTDPGFTAHRHDEFMRWHIGTDLPEDTLFLAVDDEEYPLSVLESFNIRQEPISADEGIGSRTLKAYRDIIRG